jgi:hypothetical protein
MRYTWNHQIYSHILRRELNTIQLAKNRPIDDVTSWRFTIFFTVFPHGSHLFPEKGVHWWQSRSATHCLKPIPKISHSHKIINSPRIRRRITQRLFPPFQYLLHSASDEPKRPPIQWKTLAANVFAISAFRKRSIWGKQGQTLPSLYREDNHRNYSNKFPRRRPPIARILIFKSNDLTSGYRIPILSRTGKAQSKGVDNKMCTLLYFLAKLKVIVATE